METLPPGPQEHDTVPSTPHLDTPTASSSIFYGPHGLRAGWSIFLFIGLLGTLLFFSGIEIHWLQQHFHAGPIAQKGHGLHPTIMILAEASTLLAVLLATAGMARMEQRNVASYGLAGAHRVRQFVIGLLSGFGFLSLLVGILVATHHLELRKAPMPIGQTVAYASAWGLCFLLVGMTEELMLRGYLLFTLARGIRFWPAAVLLAALFGLLHKGNAGESPFGLVAAALVALVFSLSLWRLGHLWWAIGFHASWDWAESYFYGTPDSGMVSTGRLMHAHPMGSLLQSGGATGPEGSVWITLVLVLAALFVWMTQPNQRPQFDGK